MVYHPACGGILARMRRIAIVGACVLLAVGFSACSSSSGATSAPVAAPSSDATSVANHVKAGVPTVTKVVTLDENNDSNHLLGRPNGYVSAAVLFDSGTSVKDPDPGVANGATVEVFATPEAAKTRHDFLAAIGKASPVLVNEYDYLSGATLLRVSGALKPSVAKTYQAAFGA